MQNELTTQQNEALASIAQNAANGRDLSDRLGIERKAALSTLGELEGLGLIAKNERISRFELTVTGQIAGGDLITNEHALAAAEFMARVDCASGSRVYAKDLRVVALKIERHGAAFVVHGYTEGATAGQNGWAHLANFNVAGEKISTGGNLDGDLSDEATAQIAALVAAMQPEIVEVGAGIEWDGVEVSEDAQIGDKIIVRTVTDLLHGTTQQQAISEKKAMDETHEKWDGVQYRSQYGDYETMFNTTQIREIGAEEIGDYLDRREATVCVLS